MIRRQGADGTWVLISQPDHARLSADLARAWGGDGFRAPEPLDEVLFAIAHHDDGWIEWESAPRSHPDTGVPLHFTELPIEDHLAIWRRGPARVARRDPYAGMLVSLHGGGLMEWKLATPDLGPSARAEIETYIADQARFRRELFARLERPRRRLAAPATIAVNFRLLQVLDYLSLVLCCDPAGARVIDRVPAEAERDRRAVEVIPRSDGSAMISPWPFSRPSPLVFQVASRRVTDRPYADEDLAEACAAAPVENLGFRLEAA